MDQRDDHTWIAVELSRLGETKVEEGTLDAALRSDLDVHEFHPIFVPAVSYTKAGKRITLHLMEGYVFVASGLPEIRYFSLEKKAYVNQVMSTQGTRFQMRTLSTIDNDYIEKLRSQLRGMIASDLDIGDSVKAVNGRYRSLEGTVVGMEGDLAYVHIAMRSLQVVASIPKVFLESNEGEESSGFLRV